jgi:hypothetical protein
MRQRIIQTSSVAHDGGLGGQTMRQPANTASGAAMKNEF